MGVAVGIVGGAFDPPHLGHVGLAVGGIRRFALGRLLVRVVADPGHKNVATPAEVRLALAGLAFGGLPGVEIALDPYARTVDSLEALGLQDPVFLIGADELAGFLTWKRPERVLELARLGVGTRPGVADDALSAVLAALPRPDRVEVFEIPPVDVSSTEVRERVARGERLDGLVPADVVAEIERLGLYRAA